MYSMLIASAMLLPAQAPKLAADVDETVCSHTVRIHNKSTGAIGNGVLIKRFLPQAFVLTSAHIVNMGDQIVVELFPKGADPIKINEVKVRDRSDPQQQDLAVLSFFTDKDTVPSWMKVAAPDQLPAKKQFPAFSAATTKVDPPQTRGETVLDTVEKRPGAPKSARFWKLKGLPQPGRSGGPLFDGNGRLLGICSGGDEKATYYTHIDEIETFLRNALLQPDRN